MSPRRTASFALALGLAVSAALVGAGCEAPSAEGPAERDEDTPTEARAAIVNGEIDEGHPAVVALTFSGQAFCSGTLVQPTLVITAAHCLDPSSGLDPDDIQVFFGTDVLDGGDFVDVVQAVANPEWDGDQDDVPDDIGIIRLAEPAPVEPLPIGDLPDVGADIIMVGFGITSDGANDSGTKRIGTGTLAQVEFEVFYTVSNPSIVCNGDSGGTALAVIDDVETFVGVHTRSDCFEFSVQERVDAHLGNFLEPYLVEPTCAADSNCLPGCESPDPDCPCLTDDVCNQACGPEDDDCGLCGIGNVCVTGCAVTDPDCTKCTQDGICAVGCTTTPDPDCESATVAATTVSSSSGGEGGSDGSGGGDSAGAEDDDGCAVARPGGASRDSHLAVIAAGILGVALRRRRRSDR